MADRHILSGVLHAAHSGNGSPAPPTELPPGVTIEPITEADLDATLRKMTEATAPYFPANGQPA